MPGKVEEIVLKVPVVPDGETLKYRLMGEEGKEPLAYQTQVVNKIQEEGKGFYKVYGLTEYLGKGVLEETAIYEINETLKPISFHKVVKGRSGKVLIKEEEIYEDESLEIPLNTLMQSCASTFAFRGGPFIPTGPFMPKSRITFYYLMPPAAKPLKMYTDTSKEKITVPAGTFECYKVQINPDVQSMVDVMMQGVKMPPGFETLAPNFMPPTLRWFSQKEPHYLVRAEGTIINPVPFLSPDPLIEELVSIEEVKS
jgi:hypothetical protein